MWCYTHCIDPLSIRKLSILSPSGTYYKSNKLFQIVHSDIGRSVQFVNNLPRCILTEFSIVFHTMFIDSFDDHLSSDGDVQGSFQKPIDVDSGSFRKHLCGPAIFCLFDARAL
jgi:hypothetical protein